MRFYVCVELASNVVSSPTHTKANLFSTTPSHGGLTGLQLRSSQRSSQQPLADTQALVISLAKCLLEHQGYTLYLDNLFTNVPLANALGELGIGVMGTTRRASALGLALGLSQLKQAKTSLVWGHLETQTAVANREVQCFLW
jgi:hypothetical protein